MTSLVEQLAASYGVDQQYVYPASKATALAWLASMRDRIERMEDFDRFPEGPLGVVIYAVLDSAARSCPDAGDFGLLMQGVEHITKAAASLLARNLGRDLP